MKDAMKSFDADFGQMLWDAVAEAHPRINGTNLTRHILPLSTHVVKDFYRKHDMATNNPPEIAIVVERQSLYDQWNIIRIKVDGEFYDWDASMVTQLREEYIL